MSPDSFKNYHLGKHYHLGAHLKIFFPFNKLIVLIDSFRFVIDQMNLPTDLLRSFVAVADLDGFSLAAEHLGRSQPAVSLQIKRLEALLNVSLFRRTSRKLELTEQGRQLANYARHILDLNDEAVGIFQKPQLAGEVRLGIPNEFAISFLPDILGMFARSHPDVSLSVTCDLSCNLLNKLNDRKLDLVIAIHPEKAPKTAAKSWVEDVVWITSPGNKIYTRNPIPLIVAPEGCIYRDRMLSSLEGHHKAWRIVYTSPNNGGIQAAVKARVGITALCRSTVTPDMEILENTTELPSLSEVEIGLHYHRKEIPDVALKLIEHISDRPVHPGASVQPTELNKFIGLARD